MKTRRKNLIIAIISFLIVFMVYAYIQNNWIDVEYVDVKINNLPKDLQGMKIVHVSDVHIPRNASVVETLIERIQEEKPDIIVMTGDTIDRIANINDPLLVKLCTSLSSIAETYAVTGNHEVQNNNMERFKEILDNSNVEIVEEDIIIYQKNNARLGILGLKDNHPYDYKYFKDIEKVRDIPKILLAHRTELFPTYYSDSFEIKPDLVFSGHAHGGQFRIPFINRGVLSPNQGFLPKYTSGLYKAENGVQMNVSRGLGNSIFPIRINNRPHLPIITLR